MAMFSMHRSHSICTSCVLPKEKIEEWMLSVLLAVQQNIQFNEVFSEADLLMISHRVTDVFLKEPMLLEFDFDRPGVIVGDLHGSMVDLLSTFDKFGLPPKTLYLFLGDYLDRGPFQIELFVFLLLMKLRWPDEVHLLRGNHETFDVNASFQFVRVCFRTYHSKKVHKSFSLVCDVMPVAAILNNYILCCHGGISQWMTCRRNIRNIPRPTYLKRMKLLENCLLSDILWADPAPNQRRPFLPSKRNISYTFNEFGLDSVLKALDCSLLVRAHQPFKEGACENFRGKCFTVHTAPGYRALGFHGAVLVGMPSSAEGLDLKCHKHPGWIPSRGSPLIELCKDLRILFAKDAFSSEYTTKVEGVGLQCSHCVVKVPKKLHKGTRMLSRCEIAEWVHDNAHHLLAKANIMTPPKAPAAMCTLLAALFPLYFDIVQLKGGTFRVALSSREWRLIQENHPHEKYFTTPFAIECNAATFDADPRTIELDLEGDSSGLKPFSASYALETQNEEDGSALCEPEGVVGNADVRTVGDTDPLVRCMGKIEDKNELESSTLADKLMKLFTCVSSNSRGEQNNNHDDSGIRLSVKALP